MKIFITSLFLLFIYFFILFFCSGRLIFVVFVHQSHIFYCVHRRFVYISFVFIFYFIFFLFYNFVVRVFFPLFTRHFGNPVGASNNYNHMHINEININQTHLYTQIGGLTCNILTAHCSLLWFTMCTTDCIAYIIYGVYMIPLLFLSFFFQFYISLLKLSFRQFFF